MVGRGYRGRCPDSPCLVGGVVRRRLNREYFDDSDPTAGGIHAGYTGNATCTGCSDASHAAGRYASGSGYAAGHCSGYPRDATRLATAHNDERRPEPAT
jgi:hypothetical protein